jgi:hypothetical protein
MMDAAHPPLDEQPESLDLYIAFVVVEPHPDSIDSCPLPAHLGRNGCLGDRIGSAFVDAVAADLVVVVAPVIVAFVVVVLEIVVAVVVEVVVDTVDVVVETFVGLPAFV